MSKIVICIFPPPHIPTKQAQSIKLREHYTLLQSHHLD
jgi:hypothetical protein